MKLRRPAVVSIMAILASASIPAPAQESGVLFRDVTKEAGIAFVHRSSPEKKDILESMSGGVALLDYDQDGLLDIFFVNSMSVDTAKSPESSPSALYRNLGRGKFEDVSKKAGVALSGWGMGVCVADIDGDGYPDMYVTGL